MNAPTPLRERGDALGQLLEAASRDLSEGETEAAERVRAKLFARSVDRRVFRWAPLLATACALLVFVWRATTGAGGGSPEAPSGIVDDARWSWSAPSASISPVPLRRDGRVFGVPPGQFDFKSTKPAQLKTPAARLDVEQASLRVVVAASGVTVVLVDEGVVWVRPESGQPMKLGAHQQWTNASFATEGELLHHEALRLEHDGQRLWATLVLEQLSHRSDTWGELALYDAARISLALKQPERAAHFVSEYERRFAPGTLRAEIEALAKQISR